MWMYEKRLEFPINVTKKDINMAKYIITQLGGPYGELGAALRYLQQRYTMPDGYGKALLTDIGTEELGHVEMISTLVSQLTKDANIKELEEAGLGKNYAQHGLGVFPSDTFGVPFTTAGLGITGDVVADIAEDLAAEEKARVTYEHLMDLTKDEKVLQVLAFLRQREIVHYDKFKELYEHYIKLGYKHKK